MLLLRRQISYMPGQNFVGYYYVSRKIISKFFDRTFQDIFSGKR